MVAPASGQQPAETSPDWLKKPSPDELLAVWPREALAQGRSGRAVIHCKVSVQGVLFACTVASEEPKGADFGAAAIALTPQFLMKPAIKDGRPVVAEISLPIEFRMPHAPPGSLLHSRMNSGVGFLADTVLSNIRWAAAPTYDDVVAAYPRKAAEAGVGGRATLDCRFGADGWIKGCLVIDEAPRGKGFGKAAQSMARLFRGPAVWADGKTTNGSHVQIPVGFDPGLLESERRLVGKPVWAALPDSEAFHASYPVAALQAGVGQARVALKCTVAPGGGLDACAVDSEDPQDLGFGAATLGLSGAFRLQLWSTDGLPVVGAVVRIPVRYAVKEADKPN